MGSTGIRFAGFGGQGVILAGMIIGRAATIYDGGNATLIQSFGPEARGGACSAQLIISTEPILCPYQEQDDVLVTLSQGAYTRFRGSLNPAGTLILEENLVKPHPNRHYGEVFAIPATQIAEQMGCKLILNVIMVGFATAVVGIVTPDAVRKAVRDSVPPSTEVLNLEAFEKGWNFGLERIRSSRPLPASVLR
jgi:2-oxoglutarate ferredoxin oxidoreductase subunit gamma